MADLQRSLFGVAADAPPEPQIGVPEDIAARRDAIDTTRSVLVQAPAGAGKTNLLTQRYLALLAAVDEPEQILAITFTRAATAEMRSRILHTLERARSSPEAEPGEGAEMSLARAALAHSETLGWRILEQPHRLDVQTIDSLCLRLAHAQPLLARLGGALQPAEDAKALYARAARRTTALLGAGDAALDHALSTLLLRRDNNVAEVERLLARMLEGRDAWLGVLPLAAAETVDWAHVRSVLEEPFIAENTRVLRELSTALQALPHLAQELVELARHAASNLSGRPLQTIDLQPLLCLTQLPGATHEHRHAWLALASLLLTGSNEWRKAWRDSEGFPPKGTGPGKEAREQWKRRMQDCYESLRGAPAASHLLQLLCQLRSLPPHAYSEEQWETLLAVFRVLRRAAAELRLVFAEADRVDFVEIAQAAEAVLREEGSLRGMLESDRKQHILIDEFQDTSRAQYRLIDELLSEWSHGDGRTVFVVGDPLQSIYGFRQAEVALFHQTREHGLPCGEGRRHPCNPLTLTHNFRSHHALVQALNERFARVFASSGADTFVAAQAWPQPAQERSLQLHPCFVPTEQEQQPETPQQCEADAVIRVLAQELPRIAEAQASGAGEYRIAVLVRSRPHLSAILPALRAAGIPFRAVELEPLADQPEIIDMLSLLRALLHPADRLAWLGVLRAPWCGLLLSDLHMLAGNDEPELLQAPIAELIETRTALLSPDAQARITRTWSALRAALATRYTAGNNLSLAAWVERTWMHLGGHACLDATARENVEAFLRLLDELDASGADALRSDFPARLAKLCAAPDANTNERFGVQVMTIHKAKGLGFEVVLLPGLDRKARAEETALVAMLQRPRPGDALVDELLLAPISSRDGEREQAYAWVAKQQQQREREEVRRLFYVACTRARTRLHLFATLKVKDGTLQKPDASSLAAAAWPGLAPDFETELAHHNTGDATIAIAAASAPEQFPAYTLERLPLDWVRQFIAPDVTWAGSNIQRSPSTPLFQRRESSSLLARARGTAMHALMERLALLVARDPAARAPEATETMRPSLHRLAERTLVTAATHSTVSALAAELTQVALTAAHSEPGRWLLAPHPGAGAETAWQEWNPDGTLRTVRIDRSFLAGAEPGTWGDQYLWVVDYKTGIDRGSFRSEEALTAWLDEQRQFFREQLEAYGAILAASRAEPKPLRYGVFFPELLRLIHWSGETQERSYADSAAGGT